MAARGRLAFACWPVHLGQRRNVEDDRHAGSPHEFLRCILRPRDRLVFRFRSSHHFAAPSSANFGIKGTLALSILSSAAYGFEVPTRDCRELIGTSNPPH